MTTTDVLLTEFRATGQGNVIGALQGIAGAAGGMTLAAGAAGAVAAAIAAAGMYSIKTAASFEQLRIRMNTVFRGQGEAAFGWAKQFAKETPFQLTEVVDAMTTMQALGLDSTKMLGTLGDASSALGLGSEGITRMAMQLAQMKNIGRASMEDLRVLAEAGVPVFSILSEKMGVTGDQMRRIGELGLDANKVIDALMAGMKERFGGGMAAQMASMNGKISNVTDAVQILADTIGQTLLPAVKMVTNQFLLFMDEDRIRDWGHVFKMGVLGVQFATLAWLVSLQTVEITLLKIGAALARLPLVGNKGLATKLDAMKSKAQLSQEGTLGAARQTWWDIWIEAANQEIFKGRRGAQNLDTSGKGPGGGGNSLTDALVETFIRGGGERLAKGVGGLDIARDMTKGKSPTVTIKIESAENSPLGKAMADLAKKAGYATLEAFFASPAGRAAMKGAAA